LVANRLVDGLTAACMSQCTLGRLDGLEDAPDTVRSTAALLHPNAGLFEKIARTAQKLDCGQMAMVGAGKRVVSGGGPDELNPHFKMVRDRLMFVAPPYVRYTRDVLGVWTLCPVDEKNPFVIVKPRNFSAGFVRQFRFDTMEAFHAPRLLVLCCYNHAYAVFSHMAADKNRWSPRGLWTSRMLDDYQRIKFRIGSAPALKPSAPPPLR